jgi:hypothetical protein
MHTHQPSGVCLAQGQQLRGRVVQIFKPRLTFLQKHRRKYIINDTTVEGNAQVHSGAGFDVAWHDHRPRGHASHPKDGAWWVVVDGGKDSMP